MTSRLCIHIHLHIDVCFDWRMIVSLFSYNRTRHVSQRTHGVVIASERMHDTIS